MFIRKKKYNELIAQKDNYEKIAHDTILLNGRVIESNKRLLDEMRGVQELNHNLQQQNEELLVRVEGLKAKLVFVVGQRDYYYNLLETANDGYEEGKAISRETE